ncbi:MAG: hypothetical protein ABI162_07045 [Luteolibacter sp.]
MKKFLLVLSLVFALFASSAIAVPEYQNYTPGSQPFAVSATASGSVAAGTFQVTFIPSTSFTGTIMGVAFVAADAPFTLRANAPNGLQAIPYTVTAGTLRIVGSR